MNPSHPDTSQIKVDTVYIASQFERINTTLEFLREGLDDFRKEIVKHDVEITELNKEVTSIKHSVESVQKDQVDIKESLKKPKIHPVQLWSGILASVVSAVTILTVVILSVNS